MVQGSGPQDADETIAIWKAMLDGEYEEGGAVLRLKTDMQDPNPAFRDRVLFRVSNREHPRVGTRYHVWPMLEFSWAVDDHLLGVTHVHLIDRRGLGNVPHVLAEHLHEVGVAARADVEVVEGLLSGMEARMRTVEGTERAQPSLDVAQHRGRTWVTRTGIKVDRMASAWLIRKFVDAREAKAEEVTVWGSGFHEGVPVSREFLYVDDAAEGIVLAAGKYDGREPVNIGAGREVAISNPDKVYFPVPGYTKLDLVRYYLAVAEGALRGAGLAYTIALPGSASQRNAERAGFRVAYTRMKFMLAME